VKSPQHEVAGPAHGQDGSGSPIPHAGTSGHRDSSWLPDARPCSDGFRRGESESSFPTETRKETMKPLKLMLSWFRCFKGSFSRYLVIARLALGACVFYVTPAMAQFDAPPMQPPLAPRIARGPGDRGERKPPELHRRAAEFRALRLQNERGEIPPNGLVRAWEQRRQMLRSGKAPTPAPRGPLPAVAGIQPGAWTWLGPGNIGGRIRSIVIHPMTPKTMWLGAVDGGVWKTLNGGASWFPLDDFMANMSVSSLVLDPANPDVIYAGTGEYYFAYGRVRGAGVFKSVDGGKTWSQLPATATGNFHYVNRLAIHPTNGQVLLAATTTGIHRSTDAGVSWTARGMAISRSWEGLASSADGTKLAAAVAGGKVFTSTESGQTWVPRESYHRWRSLASSADGSKLVASASGDHLYTSTDSGGTWTPRESRRQWWDVASSADGSKLVAAESPGPIFTSTDSGANWTARTAAGDRAWTSVASSSDGNKLVATVDDGRIYTSTDSGVSWTERTAAGIREWTSVASSSDGSKLVAVECFGWIYTSTDSGANWTAREEVRDWTSVASSADGAKLVAVAYGDRIYTSTNCGVTWTPRDSDRSWKSVASSADGSKLVAVASPGQIYTSTDSGVQWSQKYIPESVSDLDFDPTDPNLCIASGWNGLALYSTDGGQSWDSATGITPEVVDVGVDRIEVAYSRSSPSYVYAHVVKKRQQYNSENRRSVYDYGEVYRSIDGGHTYERRSNTETIGGNGFFHNTLWVDPTKPDVVVVGGKELFRSLNGGETFEYIGGGGIGQSGSDVNPHVDFHVIVHHPDFDGTNEKRVFVGSDGGIFVANDIYTATSNRGWTELNNNLGITQFYGGAGDPGSGVIIGGTQDNATLRYNPASGTENWTWHIGGDGGACAVDQTDSRYFYGQTQGPEIRRSTDRGASWNGHISSKITALPPAGAGESTGWIVPFILDPSNGNTMLVGVRGLWRSTDVKAPLPDWEKIKEPPTPGNLVTAIAVAPGNSGIIWVADYTGGALDGIYKTSNGASPSPNWTKINSPALPTRFVGRITIHPTNPNIVYVGFGGYSPDNLWRTSDGGATWSDISGALPDAPVWSMVIHPNNPNWIYVGTDVGVFASEDAGASWSVPSGGPANVEVDELFWMGSSLVAATWGRGMFVSLPTITRDPLILYVNSNYGGADSDGTMERPFRTVRQGYLAAANGDTLRIFPGTPGSYPEAISISKRLRVESVGGNVHIGN
jgi:photosystem II stability/assembly factor-like uncharacterized protein